jgi:predicted transcriptional regulator
MDRHFLTPELAPIFTTDEKDLGQILGTITRIADGHGLASDSGAHGHREYGDTMFVWTGAAVDVSYKVYKLLGNLGFKIYFYRLPYWEKTEDKLLKDLREDFGEKKANIGSALYEYLAWFEIGPELIHDEQSNLSKIKWSYAKDEEQALRWIIKLADVLKHLRCIAQTWTIEGDSQGSNYGYTHTQPESPERAARVLSNLARGHALLAGRNFITLEDIPIVVRTVLSTGIIDRVGLLDLLIANKGTLTTRQTADALKVTRSTALRIMTELWVIGLVEIEDDATSTDNCQQRYKKRITLGKEFQWLLEEDFQKLREGFKPVDYGAFMKGADEQPKSKGKNTFSPEQISTFRLIYSDLENAARHSNTGMEGDKTTVSGEELQDALVSRGNFTTSDAAMMIKYMVQTGFMEQPAWGTYRRRETT